MDQSTRMKNNVITLHDGQFQYLGRWVDKKSFCAFVYDKDGESKLANNYDEFEKLTSSGLWYASKMEASLKPQRKQKNGSTLSNG